MGWLAANENTPNGRNLAKRSCFLRFVIPSDEESPFAAQGSARL
jgi:hypothetical protein